jgi:uncharacterized paraquat-inducible protein A
MAQKSEVKEMTNRAHLINLRNYNSEHGCSSIWGDCSNCHYAGILAFIWSISGGGKKCPNCGFILSLRNREELSTAKKVLI